MLIFYAKIFLILYPLHENSTTHNDEQYFFVDVDDHAPVFKRQRNSVPIELQVTEEIPLGTKIGEVSAIGKISIFVLVIDVVTASITAKPYILQKILFH